MTKLKKELLCYFGLLLGPIVCFVLFLLLPLGNTGAPAFVGLSNYFHLMMEDPSMSLAFWNIFKVTILPVLIGSIAGYLIARLIGRTSLKVRCIVLAAVVFPAVVLGGLQLWMTFSKRSLGLLLELFTLKQIQSGIMWFSMLSSVLITMGGCAVLFWVLGLGKKCTGFSWIFASLGGILFCGYFCLMVLNTCTKMVRFSAASYAAHTVVTHLLDMSPTGSLHVSVLPLLFLLEAVVLSGFLIRGIDRLLFRIQSCCQEKNAA